MTDATFSQSGQPSGAFAGGARASSRKRMTAHEARVRTIRVKATRIFFLAGAMSAVLALVGSVVLRAIETASLPSTDLVQGESIVLETPRFVGRAKNGGRITVTAQKATRSLAQSDGAVQLTKPVLETSDGSKARADAGVWSQAAQTLTLSGNVVLNRQGGDVATAKTADWTSDPERLVMAGGVELVRQNGDRARADSAVWEAEEARLAISNNVSLTRADGARATSGSAVWQSQAGTLDLNQSVAINLPSGETATGQSARFVEGSGDLVLQGNALVRFASGQATSARATYQSASGRLTGEGGISITSEFGNGRADRYIYETRTKRLNLSGNAVAVIQ